jgi:hypothetical protein
VTRRAMALSAVLFVAVGCGGSDGPTDAGGGGGGPDAGGGGPDAGGDAARDPRLARFSFFVISLGAVRALSGNMDGFGGDLRYGESGDGAGLRGADKICGAAAEMAIPGAGAKTWRAFLSATTGGPGGGPVHARDRVGEGPWHDAVGRLVASNLANLLKDRPADADPAIRQDLPNEHGIPNHMDGAPGCSGGQCPNNHAVLTGTGADGALHTALTPATESTCNDWTSKEPTGSPRCGHSWPRAGSGTNWMSSTIVDGCAPCTGPGTAAGARCVGITGGYGGFYCFALTP